MLKKHPKNQCRSMLTALYLSPTIRPDYTPKPYHRTLPLYQTAPQHHTTIPHHTTKPYHCTTPYPKAVPQNFISWYLFVGSGLCECTPKPYPENRTPKPYPRTVPRKPYPNKDIYRYTFLSVPTLPTLRKNTSFFWYIQ